MPIGEIGPPWPSCPKPISDKVPQIHKVEKSANRPDENDTRGQKKKPIPGKGEQIDVEG